MKKERVKHFGFYLIRNFSLIETTLLKFTILLNLFYDFAPRFIMDSVPKKTVREFQLGRWTPLLVRRQDFQKIEKFHSLMLARYPF